MLAGGGRSRGVEFDVQGEFLPGLNAISSFTHTKFTPDTLNYGYSLVPRNAYSFWATYEIQGGPAMGFGFGGGVFGRDGYLAVDGSRSRTQVPSQVRADLTAFYKFDKMSLTAGVKNVFDRHLYGDYVYNDQVNVLNGRTFIVTLGAKF